MAERRVDSSPVREIMRDLPEMRPFYQSLLAAEARSGGEVVSDALVHLRGLAELRETLRAVPQVRQLYDEFLNGVAVTIGGRPSDMEPALIAFTRLLRLAKSRANGAVQEAAIHVTRGLSARPRPRPSKPGAERRTPEERFSLLLDMIVYVLTDQNAVASS